MSNKNPDEHMLALRVPVDLVKQLDARAKYLRGKFGYKVTRSDVARNMIKDGLKNEKKKG